MPHLAQALLSFGRPIAINRTTTWPSTAARCGKPGVKAHARTASAAPSATSCRVDRSVRQTLGLVALQPFSQPPSPGSLSRPRSHSYGSSSSGHTTLTPVSWLPDARGFCRMGHRRWERVPILAGAVISLYPSGKRWRLFAALDRLRCLRGRWRWHWEHELGLSCARKEDVSDFAPDCHKWCLRHLRAIVLKNNSAKRRLYIYII